MRIYKKVCPCGNNFITTKQEVVWCENCLKGLE